MHGFMFSVKVRLTSFVLPFFPNVTQRQIPEGSHERVDNDSARAESTERAV